MIELLPKTGPQGPTGPTGATGAPGPVFEEVAGVSALLEVELLAVDDPAEVPHGLGGIPTKIVFLNMIGMISMYAPADGTNIFVKNLLLADTSSAIVWVSL